MSSDNNKKPDGIILYREKYELIANLNDEQRGKLLLALFEFAFDEQVNTELDAITNMVFITIKQSIEYNNERYKRICEMRKRIGQRGGAPKGNKNAQKYKNNRQNNQKQPENNQNNQNNQNNLLVDFSETTTNKEFGANFETPKNNQNNQNNQTQTQTITQIQKKSLLANASKPKENQASEQAIEQASLFLKFWNKHLKSKSKLNQRETQLLSDVLKQFSWQDIESAIAYCAQKDSLNGSAAGSFKIAPIYFLEHTEALIAEAWRAHEKQAAADERAQNAIIEAQRRQQAAREQAAEEARHRAAVVPMPAYFADKWCKKKPTAK